MNIPVIALRSRIDNPGAAHAASGVLARAAYGGRP